MTRARHLRVLPFVGRSGTEAPAADARADAELVAALPSDDGSALATLYDRHAGLVYGLALRMLENGAAAEDLTQEVFVTLASEHTYDPRRGSLSAYLVTMVRSRALDRLRARGRHGRLLKRWHEAEPPPAPPTPHQEASAHQRTVRVRAAMAALSDQERQVLELAYYQGMTQTEIATHLDAPLGSVKSWARRGLLRLRGELEDLME